MDKNSLSHTTWNCKYHKQTLENPFLGKRLPFFPPSPVPKNRRRRQAPARGPAAVCFHHRSIRTETQHTRPLLVGRVCVYFEPTALAGGTAALARRRLRAFWQVSVRIQSRSPRSIRRSARAPSGPAMPT